MKVLITGGSGALGRSLKKVFKDAYCPKHWEMEVTDEEKVHKVVLDYKPNVLIHTAAFVSVRGCEEN
ncbi:MAG: sugar nucleotide-binding protein, partial [Flavobacteriales bacterium]|nr:sugar nucleotide-binding protein [Flavobacteriales bacterium]